MAKKVEEKVLDEQKEVSDKTGRTLEVTKEETEMKNFSLILAAKIRNWCQPCQSFLLKSSAQANGIK
jgi:hypothetical protein